MRKCYNKPNRARKRVFTACDAARIAREVVKEDKETSPEEVLACIARGLGFRKISLTRQQALPAGVDIRKVPVSDILVVLKKTVEVLLSRYPILKRVLGPVLVLIKKAIEALDKIEVTLDSNEEDVEKVINKDKCKCKDEPTEKERQHGNQK